jgi:hypothetical protein
VAGHVITRHSCSQTVTTGATAVVGKRQGTAVRAITGRNSETSVVSLRFHAVFVHMQAVVGDAAVTSPFKSIRHVFRSYLRTINPRHDFEKETFATAWPRDSSLPAQLLTLAEFDELTHHSIWLAQMYCIQAYPARQAEHLGVAIRQDRNVKHLHTTLAAIKAKQGTTTSAIKVW